MELYQLEYLVALEKYKTLLETANQLHVSQPSITKAIKKLEDEFGFALFDRVKNRLVLNMYGEEVIAHAKKILSEVELLKISTNALFQQNFRITIGSNAPAPLWGIQSLLDHSIGEIINDNEVLIKSFRNHLYSMIILDYPMKLPNCECKEICKEQLYISVDKTHELSKFKAVSFKDIDGYNFLVLSRIGYWYDITTQNMPTSNFLFQDNVDTYNILVKSSSLPVFRTNLTIPSLKNSENKVYIPIIDSVATLNFYAIYDKKNAPLFNNVIKNINSISWENYRSKNK